MLKNIGKTLKIKILVSAATDNNAHVLITFITEQNIYTYFGNKTTQRTKNLNVCTLSYSSEVSLRYAVWAHKILYVFCYQSHAVFMNPITTRGTRSPVSHIIRVTNYTFPWFLYLRGRQVRI